MKLWLDVIIGCGSFLVMGFLIGWIVRTPLPLPPIPTASPSLTRPDIKLYVSEEYNVDVLFPDADTNYLLTPDGQKCPISSILFSDLTNRRGQQNKFGRALGIICHDSTAYLLAKIMFRGKNKK